MVHALNEHTLNDRPLMLKGHTGMHFESKYETVTVAGIISKIRKRSMHAKLKRPHL
jgi:hypothetical protein